MTAVKILSGEHKISTLCRVLNVCRSTYYKFLNHQKSNREIENTEIRKAILDIYSKSDKRLGADKMTICLARDHRINISRGRVYRLMKSMNLPKMSTRKPPKPQRIIPDDNSGNRVNHLKQRFDQPFPNKVWVSDFTYLKAGGKTYYLCAVMDLFSRMIIAYRLSSRIDTELAIRTLDDAVKFRKTSNGVIFHTDQGSQFTSAKFRKRLDELGMIQSFSAKGHPYDNAVMECFFKYLKAEETDRHSYASFDDLRLSVFKYISGFYNSLRPHSHNNGLSPIQVEEVT